MAQINIEVDTSYFIDAYLPLLDNEERFNVLWGGGGSGKSHFVADKMILKAFKYPNRTILLVRKVQAAIKDSIFQLVVDELSRMGLLRYCKVSTYNLTIDLPNGSKFICKGLDDPEKIKSITGVDDIVIEEATEITSDDFSQLNLRLRSQAPNQQIHLMFNPVAKTNWVYSYFFESIRNNTIIVHTTYKDNPHLPQEYIESLEEYKTTNPLYYDIYCLGQWGVLGKRVYNNWKVEEFDPYQIIREVPSAMPIFGLDFGYIADPSAFLGAIADTVNKKLYIFTEFYERGLLNDQIAERIIEEGYSKEVITADSAEKKSIDEIKGYGVRRIKPAKKGAGSVAQGIQYINQFEIIVHPDCVFTKAELQQYVYKKDKASGLYTNTPVDNHNHLMDALRYALERVRKKLNIRLTKRSFGL